MKKMNKNFARALPRKRSTRRLYVFELAKKLTTLADYLSFGNTVDALAKGLGISSKTTAEAAAGEGCTAQFHLHLKEALSKKGKIFESDWIEWRDPANQNQALGESRPDSAEKFIDRFKQENEKRICTKQKIGFDTPGPAVSLHQYISKLDLSNVEIIMVFATTGSVTVREVRQALGETTYSNSNKPIQIRVLLSSAYMSDDGRAADADQTRKDLLEFQIGKDYFKIEMRTYASASIFRGAIVKHIDGSYSGNLGYYYWGLNKELTNRSVASNNNEFFTRNKITDPLLEVYISWFNHYWGNSIINTIIFDFDDTIFSTTNAQIAGWLGAIQKALKDGAISEEMLQPEMRGIARDDLPTMNALREIFLDEQIEDRILARIFEKQPPEKILNEILRERFYVRERLTENESNPIPYILNDIRQLVHRYRLVIVSATEEKMIRRVLRKHEILHLFSYVFGRNTHRTNKPWKEVETKAQLFVRLSSMLGIPLERIIFVGDSDADYRAAKQLSMQFIENTFSARRFGRKSLIKAAGSTHEAITGSSSGELVDTIHKIERKVADDWSKF